MFNRELSIEAIREEIKQREEGIERLKKELEEQTI